MDAMEFCKQLDRICKSHWSCESCPLGDGKCSIRYIGRNRESVVKIVEQWAKDHPAKTRQSEFLKQFPNANMFAEKMNTSVPIATKQNGEQAQAV